MRIFDNFIEIDKLDELKNNYITQIGTMLRSLPDNPKIQRVAPNCFIMQKSELKDDWSAEHYDFKLQYRELAKAVARANNPKVALQLILEEGKIVRTIGGEHYGAGVTNKHKIVLHEEVIKNIKAIW